ncbi:hypothetical protein FRC19_008014 [Serendipita sp. 401]|nr:hypothetical protein FRC19_008014 [Serendipita sp. 401]
MSFSRELQANFETVPTSLTFSFKDTSTGILTRTLWWPAKAGDPSAILVFVCGNPGIPIWYIDFLNSIRDRVSNSSLAILAIGHVGHAHDLPQPPSDASLSLQVQIDVANATRRRLLQLFPNVPHIVIGHSIGAYIALQSPRDLLSCTTLTIALQPTISHIGSTSNGRVLKHIFTPWLIPFLASLGSILMHLFPFILPRMMSAWPKPALRTLEEFISCKEATRSSMTMARDEFQKVRDLDRKLLQEVAPKLRILYSETGDKWIDQNSDEVIEVLGDNYAHQIAFAPVPHAFCIEHSLLTAEAVLPWIEEALTAVK